MLISKSLIDSNIFHDEFVSINNVLKEYEEMKEEIKNVKTESAYQRFQSIYKTMLSYCLNCRKCPVCDSKKSKFIKQQEARGLLSSLGI